MVKIRNIGKEIIDGLGGSKSKSKSDKKGKLKRRVIELLQPSKTRVIREKRELSQSAFAGLPGVSMRAL